MAPEGFRGCSGTHFRPKLENRSRRCQKGFLEPFLHPSQKIAPEGLREASWKRFRAQIRKWFQRASEGLPAAKNSVHAH
eukprot:1159553-Karenia_brevis.AAC.2